MSNVILMLSSEIVLAQPKPPIYYMEGDSLKEHSLPSKNESSTANELTVTLVDDR